MPGLRGDVVIAPRPTSPPGARLSLEEEAARAALVSEEFMAELLAVLGFGVGREPSRWWRGPWGRAHVGGWIAVHGLTKADILEVARLSRRDHPEPPEGPKALDRRMAGRGTAKGAALQGRGRRGAGKARSGRAAPPAPEADVLDFWAARVLAGESLFGFSEATAARLVEAGRLRRADLLARGFTWPWLAEAEGAG